MKGAGAIVSLDYNGKLSIDRGLIAPEAQREGDGAKATVKPKPEYSAKLMDELAHQHTTTLRHALSEDPKAALAVLAQTLVSQVLYNGYTTTALNIRAISIDTERENVVPNRLETSAATMLEAKRIGWKKRLPKDESRLFSWLMKQDQATINDLLVLTTALSLQANIPANGAEHDRRSAATDLGRQLTPAFDMADYWEATSDGFISRLSKAQMAKALQDTGQSPLAERVLKMKREEAIRETARALKGKRWLPTPLEPR